MCRLRSDCTYPGDPGAIIKRRARPACPVTSAAAKDREWIPLAAERRWVVITRDSKITEHRREIDAVMEHGGRHVTFAGADAGNPWEQLEILMRQWRRIEQLIDEPGLFIYLASRTRLRKLDLTG